LLFGERKLFFFLFSFFFVVKKATPMKSLSPEIRRLIVACRRKGKKVKEICDLFGVSAYTVWKWCMRAHHQGSETFEDMPRNPNTIRRKIDAPVENAILALRTAFN
jgi:transposase-like protein